MGDQSHSQLYTDLLGFLNAHGVSLESEGCAETGLFNQDLWTFLALLERNSVTLLGFDVWRSRGVRRNIDHAFAWASRAGGGPQDYAEARSLLRAAVLLPEDVVVVQFS